MLFERLDQEIAPLRTVYDQLIQDPARIELTLKAGADKARAIASPFTGRLRHAVGLRPLQSSAVAKTAKTAKANGPSFKQYREKDGQFHFKLLDAQGKLLLQSDGFVSPRDAAACIKHLQNEAANVGEATTGGSPAGVSIAVPAGVHLAEGASESEVQQALLQFAQAQD